jgi:lysozyme
LLKTRLRKKRIIALLVIIAGIIAFWNYKRLHVRFVHYAAFGIDMPEGYSIHGIDISKYQSDINWKEVKDMQENGVRINFVFIKATEGISRQDGRFDYHWRKAKSAGIIRGAYHFFYSTRDPLLQAKNFESTVHLEPGDLPPVLDIEVSNNQPDSIIRKTAKIWLNAIEKKYGVKPIIYTNINFYKAYLGKAFNEYPLWISHYYNNDRPPAGRSWTLWQLSDSGHVNGISSPVDFNVFNGDSTDFNKLLLP